MNFSNLNIHLLTMKKAVFAKKVIDFYSSLDPNFRLPNGFSIMNPFNEPQTFKWVNLFYHKFYNDSNKRYFVFGINPGRLGGGLTGIPFTDPVHLRNDCHIENQLPAKKELSSEFIYKMIMAYGGTAKFYDKFFLTAVCPLGFIHHDKNSNYYDTTALIKSTRDFIRSTLTAQATMGSYNDTCFCLGQGKNMEHLQELNDELGLFKTIIPLAHPRWIMQYRRKSVEQYIEAYLIAFSHV